MKEKWNTNTRLDSNLWCAHQEIPFLHAAGRHAHDLSCEIFIKVHPIYSSFHRSKHTFHSQGKHKPLYCLVWNVAEWVFQITTVIIPEKCFCFSGILGLVIVLVGWHPPLFLLNFYWKDDKKIFVVWFNISKSSIILCHTKLNRLKSYWFKNYLMIIYDTPKHPIKVSIKLTKYMHICPRNCWILLSCLYPSIICSKVVLEYLLKLQ